MVAKMVNAELGNEISLTTLGKQLFDKYDAEWEQRWDEFEERRR